jgi:integrase
MPWVKPLPNGKFRACWRDDMGTERSRSGFNQEAAAKRYAGEQEGKSRRGELSRDGRAPKWGDWCDEWLARRRVASGTARQDAVRIDKHLRPHWANQRMNRITNSMVQDWINELSVTPATVSKPKRPGKDYAPPPVRYLSPATVTRIYHLFSASMKAAVIDGRIAASPCVGVKIAPAAPGHERYLTRTEFDNILFHLAEPYRTAAVILTGTGMRFGELAGLHWARVDLEQGLLHVIETWDPVDRVVKPFPKGKVARTVPIVSWVRDALTTQLDRLAGEPAGNCGQTHTAGVKCRSPLVVTLPGGSPLDGHNFGQREWARAVKLSGVGHARPHDLRHSYASWLVQDGVPLQEVQRLLGHVSIITTQRYANLGDSQNEKVRAALEGRLSPVR